MARKKKSVVAKLRGQVDQGSLADDVTIVYHLIGGVGDDRVDESLVVTAPGSLHVRVRDGLGTKPEGEAREEIGRDEALDLCRLLLQGVESMVPASKASFIPDTLVASVSLAIGNEKETFYFAADDEDCEHRGQPIKPEIQKILGRLGQIEANCLSDTDQGGRGRGKEIGE